MNLTRNSFLALFIGFLFVSNIILIWALSYGVLQFVVGMIFVMFIPGSLIMRILAIKTESFWEYFTLAAGISLGFVIIYELIYDLISLQLDFQLPLRFLPMLVSLDVGYLILVVITYICWKNPWKISLGKPTPLSFLFYVFTVIFPLRRVGGAFRLNNGSSNILTIIMLVLIPMYVVLLVLVRKKLSQNVFPHALFIISFSLLSTVSMRSWHIFGWDINDEFRIFELTNRLGHWEVANSNHAYNTCLSLTILPTVFAHMTWIPDEYVFKFIYQIVFSLLPLTIYFTVKKYFKYELAFLAGYYFISQPLYIQPMTGLMRQEIGFVFFALMIMSAFKDNLSIPMRKGLFLFFGSLMIMSHYSTSYIAVVLMILSFIAHKIFVFLITRLKGLHRIKKLYDALPINDANISRNIGGFSLIALAAFTFFWNMQFSTTGSNLLYVANRTVMNMKNIFNDDLKSQDTTRYLSLAATANISTQDVIEKYFNSIDPLQAKYPKEFYSTEATASYAAAPYFAPMIPSKLNPSLTHLGVTGAMIFRSMTKILLLPGLLFLLFILYKKHKFDSEYLVITGVCGILLVTILVVPFLSLQYNVDRLFLQILIFLVTAIITALVYIMWFIKDSIKFVVIALLFAFYFMLNMRLDSQILGGEHFVQLYNVGDDYDKFYIHESEVKAAEWLTRNHINKKTIHADKVATLRLYSFGGPNLRPIENDIVPSLIRVDGYVYADYANLITNRTEARALGKNISYTFPSDFLFDNKNTIYNNGTTKIYK